MHIIVGYFMVFILLRKNLIRLITRPMCLTTDDQGIRCVWCCEWRTKTREKKQCMKLHWAVLWMVKGIRANKSHIKRTKDGAIEWEAIELKCSINVAFVRMWCAKCGADVIVYGIRFAHRACINTHRKRTKRWGAARRAVKKTRSSNLALVETKQSKCEQIAIVWTACALTRMQKVSQHQPIYRWYETWTRKKARWRQQSFSKANHFKSALSSVRTDYEFRQNYQQFCTLRHAVCVLAYLFLTISGKL